MWLHGQRKGLVSKLREKFGQPTRPSSEVELSMPHACIPGQRRPSLRKRLLGAVQVLHWRQSDDIEINSMAAGEHVTCVREVR